MKHLWEARHPYYCNEGNYFDNNCYTGYKSWGEFMAAEGCNDFDMNLVFRWDWREGEHWGLTEFNGDINYRHAKLLIILDGTTQGLISLQ